GRAGGRPLSTRQTIHLTLRSSQARGEWSFRRPQNFHKVRQIFRKFSSKYGVRVLGFANVGNHLHLQIRLTRLHLYSPFIRAVTSAVAMAVTGASRWKKAGDKPLRFWDYRPFTRVVESYRAYLNL